MRSLDDAGLPVQWQADARKWKEKVYKTMIHTGWDQFPGPSGRSVLILT